MRRDCASRLLLEQPIRPTREFQPGVGAQVKRCCCWLASCWPGLTTVAVPRKANIDLAEETVHLLSLRDQQEKSLWCQRLKSTDQPLS
ncbi:hypothetical protein RRG08_025140 [Elysia crispata]|uniref:Uncharacterized protein n=1 Tax=Elysia crispata TaxID=231223 RepID=A0AAE0YCD4_9GAST|nr:hypothetical protein RRG08_025140 [Elysia crispata]